MDAETTVEEQHDCPTCRAQKHPSNQTQGSWDFEEAFRTFVDGMNATT